MPERSGALADPARMRSLRRACVGTEPDEAFDRFAAMVCRLVGVPVALVSLVEAGRQFFPGECGLGRRETPISHSFCRHVVDEGRELVVPDARRDARVRDNPAIADLGVVAYAGMPLTDADGNVLGSLCAIDGRPRDWTAAELATLADLAAACSSELRLRISQHLAETARQHLAMRVGATEGLARADSVADVLHSVFGALMPGLADWCVATVTGAEIVWSHPEPRRGPDLGLLGEAVAARFTGEPAVTLVPGRAVPAAPPGVPVRIADELVAGPARRLGGVCLSVPIPAPRSGRPLGIVTIGLVRDRLTDAELGTVLDIARAAGLAVQNCRLQQRRRHVTEVLQRSMLSDLPRIPGVELHARYQPAVADATVGGDWYDAFVQPDSSVMLAVGDVCGHDIKAAATMGQLRNLVRGNAWGRPDEPGDVLAHLHAAIHGMDLRATATMLLARVRPDRHGWTVRYASAGHLPPLVLCPDGKVQVWWTTPEPLLGLLPFGARTTHRRTVPPGSTLLFYTDGLVEAPMRSVDDMVGHLTRLLEANCHLPGDRLCDTLLAAAPRRSDDTALLLTRLGPGYPGVTGG